MPDSSPYLTSTKKDECNMNDLKSLSAREVRRLIPAKSGNPESGRVRKTKETSIVKDRPNRYRGSRVEVSSTRGTRARAA